MNLTTPEQYQKLKADILADPVLGPLYTDPTKPQGDVDFDIAKAYNLLAVPECVVYYTRTPYDVVADATSAADLANITQLNLSRYTTLMDISPTGIVPTLDRRTAFEDIFSGANGANTRPKLGLAGTAWKRPALATRAEKLYATGAGTSAAPATMTLEGALSAGDVHKARTA